MPEFNEPESRNEAILQNMLGADNDLGEPQSRIETLLMQLLAKLPNLPEITENDEGKVLGVVSGEWAFIEVGSGTKRR